MEHALKRGGRSLQRNVSTVAGIFSLVYELVRTCWTGRFIRFKMLGI